MQSCSSLSVQSFLKWRELENKHKEALFPLVEKTFQTFFRIYKTIKIYRIDNPIFKNQLSEFIDLLNHIEFVDGFSVAVRKTGFYFLNKELELDDEEFKPFLRMMVTNGIKEMFFAKGIDAPEITRFFLIAQRFIAHNDSDSDILSTSWDAGIEHLIFITDMESGDSENFQEFDFENKSEINNLEEILPILSNELINIASSLKSSDNKSLEALRQDFENYSEESVICAYFERLKIQILDDKNKDSIGEVIEIISFFPDRLLNSSSIQYGAAFFKSLLALESTLKKTKSQYAGEITAIITKITSNDFIDNIFVQAKHIKPEKYNSFAEMIGIMSSYNFARIFINSTNLDSKDLRLVFLSAIAGNMKEISVVKELIESDDWKLVRNVLYLLELSKNADFLPLIRKIINHPIEQVRVEAISVLSKYSVEEALPMLEKAISSENKEVRALAVKKLSSLGSFRAKAILDRVFRPANLNNFTADEIEDFIKIVAGSANRELFDLVGNLLFYQNKEIRIRSMKYIKRLGSSETLSRIVLKKISDEDFFKTEKDELTEFVKLFVPEIFEDILPALEKIWTLKGGLFNRHQFIETKKIVISQLMMFKTNINIVRWVSKALKSGDEETISIINSFKENN